MARLKSLLAKEEAEKGQDLFARRFSVTHSTLPNEIEKLKEKIESLFVRTTLFDEQSLVVLLNVLGQTTMNALEACTFTNIKENDSEITDFKALNLFGLDRMIDVVVANFSRIQIFWEYIAAHLDSLANSKFIQLRGIAIEAIFCLISSYFEYQIISNTELNWKETEWQQIILTPLLNSIQNSFLESISALAYNLPFLLEVHNIIN